MSLLHKLFDLPALGNREFRIQQILTKLGYLQKRKRALQMAADKLELWGYMDDLPGEVVLRDFHLQGSNYYPESNLSLSDLSVTHSDHEEPSSTLPSILDTDVPDITPILIPIPAIPVISHETMQTGSMKVKLQRKQRRNVVLAQFSASDPNTKTLSCILGGVERGGKLKKHTKSDQETTTNEDFPTFRTVSDSCPPVILK